MEIKDILEITFNEKEFKTSEQSQVFDKPEFKKFNMKFHNLDLLIIDAIAKRDSTSRAQIINMFIENILKDFLRSFPLYEGLMISMYVEDLYDAKGKTNKEFAWHYWLIEQSGYIDTPAQAVQSYMHQALINGGDQEMSPDFKNFIMLFSQHKAKLRSTTTKSDTIADPIQTEK